MDDANFENQLKAHWSKFENAVDDIVSTSMKIAPLPNAEKKSFRPVLFLPALATAAAIFLICHVWVLKKTDPIIEKTVLKDERAAKREILSCQYVGAKDGRAVIFLPTIRGMERLLFKEGDDFKGFQVRQIHERFIALDGDDGGKLLLYLVP